MNCVALSDELSVQVVEILDTSPEVIAEDGQLQMVSLLDDKIITVELEDMFISCG